MPVPSQEVRSAEEGRDAREHGEAAARPNVQAFLSMTTVDVLAGFRAIVDAYSHRYERYAPPPLVVPGWLPALAEAHGYDLDALAREYGYDGYTAAILPAVPVGEYAADA